jgi:hypothetical protein
LNALSLRDTPLKEGDLEERDIKTFETIEK